MGALWKDGEQGRLGPSVQTILPPVNNRFAPRPVFPVSLKLSSLGADSLSILFNNSRAALRLLTTSRYPGLVGLGTRAIIKAFSANGSL